MQGFKIVFGLEKDVGFWRNLAPVIVSIVPIIFILFVNRLVREYCSWKMVVSADIFVSAAHKFLCSGSKKKRLTPSSCLDIAVQIIAVDLGLKPALLYDSNAASAQQVEQYLNSLQEDGFVSTALHIVAIDGNVLVVNSKMLKLHLEELLQTKNLITVDVDLRKPQPCMCVLEDRTENMVKVMMGFFTDLMDKQCLVSVVGEEWYSQWNLCTLFGILLGYPASYWFDQAQGFENCLSMTPLVVNKVWIDWQTSDGRHNSCLYSFSVPEVLWSEVRNKVEQWNQDLKERFSKQTVFTELSFFKETLTLPSVTL